MYLEKADRVAAGEFIAGALWQAMERALGSRRPANSEATESAETAAHRAFERKGYEKCMEDVRRLAVEAPPSEEGPIPATLLDPND